MGGLYKSDILGCVYMDWMQLAITAWLYKAPVNEPNLYVEENAD
jgi:hypothetical protein